MSKEKAEEEKCKTLRRYTVEYTVQYTRVCDVFRKNKKVLCRPLSRAGNGEIEALCDWARCRKGL